MDLELNIVVNAVYGVFCRGLNNDGFRSKFSDIRAEFLSGESGLEKCIHKRNSVLQVFVLVDSFNFVVTRVLILCVEIVFVLRDDLLENVAVTSDRLHEVDWGLLLLVTTLVLVVGISRYS